MSIAENAPVAPVVDEEEAARLMAGEMVMRRPSSYR